MVMSDVLLVFAVMALAMLSWRLGASGVARAPDEATTKDRQR
jgi:hypothetical protein